MRSNLVCQAPAKRFVAPCQGALTVCPSKTTGFPPPLPSRFPPLPSPLPFLTHTVDSDRGRRREARRSSTPASLLAPLSRSSSGAIGVGSAGTPQQGLLHEMPLEICAGVAVDEKLVACPLFLAPLCRLDWHPNVKTHQGPHAVDQSNKLARSDGFPENRRGTVGLGCSAD